jgi:hypothetical protein
VVKINKNAISYLAIKNCFTRFLSNYFFCRPPPASVLFLALVALVVLEAPVSFVSFARRDFIIAVFPAPRVVCFGAALFLVSFFLVSFVFVSFFFVSFFFVSFFFCLLEAPLSRNLRL